MSEISASSYCCPPIPILPPEASVAGRDRELVDDFFSMVDDFGADGVVTASEARVIRNIGEYIKSQIRDSDLPPGVMNLMCETIDAQIADAESAVAPEIDEAMCGSACAEGIDNYCNLVREGLELANEQGLHGQEALDFAQDYARDVMDTTHDDTGPTDPAWTAGHELTENQAEEAANEGVSSGTSSTDGAPSSASAAPGAGADEPTANEAAEADNEAVSGGNPGAAPPDDTDSSAPGAPGAGAGEPTANEAAEAANEAVSGGGGEGLDADDITDQMLDNIHQSGNESREDENGGKAGGLGGGSGNWLIALAKGLAMIQDKFLSEALDNLKIMEDNANYSENEDTGGDAQQGQKSEFLIASSKYQAATQMFSMMANMTATSLKSIGEGLTAVARKQ